MSSKPTAHDVDADKFEDELKPGTTLLHGQYVIEKFLNNGGFGITYLAKDSLHRMVVIKECFPESICRRTASTVRVRSRNQAEAFRTIVELFIEEARKLARLSHPNIVGVHQVFEDNDTAYMAMDFVEGRDFLDILESGSTLEPATMERVVIRLLDAIEFIHHQGILHRDISPDNILLGRDNQPVLIDFGAARETVTRATRFLGAMRTVKDGYSPQEFYVTNSEQFPSSDLYSLAASLYHLLTREIPMSAQERLSAIASGDGDPYVSIKGRVDGYSDTFLDAIDQALNVFPKNRIQSAAEWRAMITRSTVSRMTRGTVSQPVLAVDNGNVLEQFEQANSQSLAGGLRRADNPADAADLAAGVKTPADETRKTREENLKKSMSTPAKKSSGGGLYMGVAAAAVLAVVGVGAFVMTGTSGAPDGTESAVLTEPLAEDTALDAAEDNLAVAQETETAPPVVFEPAPAPLSWEIARQQGAASAPAASEEAAPQVVTEASPGEEQGEEVAAVETDAATPTVQEASSIITGKALEFLVFPDPDDPTLIAHSYGAAAEQLSPGLRVVSINGFPISSLDEFQRVANVTAGYEIGENVQIAFGLEDPSGNTFVRDVKIPAVQQTMLLNGASFQTSQMGDDWITLVTTGTGQDQSDLQPGDRIVALMPDNELIDTEDGLKRVIQREIDDGNTQFNFAVNRNGAMWFAAMRYAGAPEY